MITIKNVKNQGGSSTDIFVRSLSTQTIDAKGLLLTLPAMIDVDSLNFSQVISNEEWEIQTKALLQAGITTAFLEGISPEQAKIVVEQVNSKLEKASIPLSVDLFADGSNPIDFNSIGKSKAFFKGIKTSIDLENITLPPYENALEGIFQISAQEDLIIIIDLLQTKKDVSEQRKAALAAVKKSIELTEKYSAQLCLKHVRTKDEIALIKQAKDRDLLVYVEVDCPHLFISEASGSKIASPHFFPSSMDLSALWEALNSGIIDFIGSGCNVFSTQDPTLAAKQCLPLLLTAYHEKKLRLDTLIAVTRVNAENIFRLPPNEDVILVDLNTSRPSNINPKNTLTGWPVYVIAQGELIRG